eukprot:CAMPEP_0171840062 /NCGR_PEP_ID=MMETSP0992-20121227/13740_1 /TAXON_ID=483369 /ORGANISM="non described non described, Strain CCMP2098" /LENGTH=507 /DNA_ID=CAMNT_0012456775 /DNA_START=138 /DNA_END=1662 /DNA_ORIENTATION=-
MLLETSVGVVVFGLSVYYLLLKVYPKKVVPYSKSGWVENVKALSSSRQPWFFLEHALATPGRCYRLRMPTWSPFYVVADGAAARILLTSLATEKPAIYRHFEKATQDSPTIFTMLTQDPRWRAARKGAAHAFASTKIAAALKSDATNRKIGNAVDFLERLARNGESFDPAALMTELTMDILGVAMLGGFDFGLVQGRINEMSEKLNHQKKASLGHEFLLNLHPIHTEYALRQANNPLRALTLSLLPRFFCEKLVSSAAEADAAAERNMAISKHILDDFRERRKTAAPDALAAMNMSVLGHLADNTKYESDAMRIADVATFIVGGHDTTGFTLAWTLIELARHPDILATLRLDVQAKGVDSDYLQAVIHESMRLWPVAAGGPVRSPTESIQIKDDLIIPKGATCFIPFLAIHRAANVKVPNEFIPGRWLENEALDDGFEDPNISFFPFSLGARNCVGQALASAELRHVLAAVVSRFEFALQISPTPEHFLTLKPDGARLTVKIVGEYK